MQLLSTNNSVEIDGKRESKDSPAAHRSRPQSRIEHDRSCFALCWSLWLPTQHLQHTHCEPQSVANTQSKRQSEEGQNETEAQSEVHSEVQSGGRVARLHSARWSESHTASSTAQVACLLPRAVAAVYRRHPEIVQNLRGQTIPGAWQARVRLARLFGVELLGRQFAEEGLEGAMVSTAAIRAGWRELR